MPEQNRPSMCKKYQRAIRWCEWFLGRDKNEVPKIAALKCGKFSMTYVTFFHNPLGEKKIIMPFPMLLQYPPASNIHKQA